MNNIIFLQSIMSLKGIGRKKSFKISNKLKLNIKINEKEFIEQITNIKEFELYKIQIDELKKNIENFKKIFDQHSLNEINAIAYFDAQFPKKLLNISDPPMILYYKGNIEKLNTLSSIAVIGARKPSLQSYAKTNDYSQIIGENNIAIISGLAKGCDTAAHKGALEKNAFTVAVMPSSLDEESVYPKENKDLFNKILENNNCVISEYCMGNIVQHYQFIERDRLQSGLSNSILIVETTQKGGTMHTYKFAVEQSKLIGCCNINSDNDRFSGNIEIMKNPSVIKISNHDNLQNFIKLSKEIELTLL